MTDRARDGRARQGKTRQVRGPLMLHTAPAHGASGQSRLTLARSQRESDPDAANWLSYVKCPAW